MSEKAAELLWLHQEQSCSLTEVADWSGLSETEIIEWVEVGVLTPSAPQEEPWSFSADCLLSLRTACRLRRDFDLDAHSAALMVSLLDRVHRLEAEVRALRAQFPLSPT